MQRSAKFVVEAVERPPAPAAKRLCEEQIGDLWKLYAEVQHSLPARQTVAQQCQRRGCIKSTRTIFLLVPIELANGAIEAFSRRGAFLVFAVVEQSGET